MAEFLTTSGSVSSIEKIITRSQKKLAIVSPYIQISQNFFQRLKDAEKRDVVITLIFGKTAPVESELRKLSYFKNLKIYFCENLHAKCYLNEQEAVISSMNFYEFSHNNREMGILIKKSAEPDAFQGIANEVKSIIDNSTDILKLASEKKGTQGSSFFSPKLNTPAKVKGTCIRCEDTIPLNIEKPFCYDCYSEWAEYYNEDYEEDFCHLCGDEKSTSMAKPLCKKCYKEVSRY